MTDLSPEDKKGNDKPSPDDKGDGGKSPVDDKGHDKDKGIDYQKRYDDLRPDYDKKSTRLSNINKTAEKYGYDVNDPDFNVEQFIADLDFSYQELSGKSKDGGKGGGKDDDRKPPEKPPDLSADLKRSLAISTKLSLDAKKDGQFEAFLRKHPDFDESLRPELDKEIDSLMDENARVFQKGNWYGIAEKSKMLKGDDYITKIKKSAIAEEEERKKKLGDLESETGGATAGGQSKGLEKELKERLG